jgi:hypothetical protein
MARCGMCTMNSWSIRRRASRRPEKVPIKYSTTADASRTISALPFLL